MMRASHWAWAIVGAVGAGLLLYALPVGFIETIVASSGLSEAIPAAAPPLGQKARLLLAGFGAAMTLGVIAVRQRDRRIKLLTHDRQESGEDDAAGVSEMGFALPKLNWLSRHRRKAGPALRRADAHPDAPARPPIFASRDFGGLDIFPRVASGRVAVEAAPEPSPAAEQEAPVPAMGLSIPSRPEVTQEAAFARIQRAFAPPAESEAVEEGEAIAAPASPGAGEPVAQLSLSELAERLERGLARRRRVSRPPSVLADMPVETPVPVRDHVERNADEALRAALGTLRDMTSRPH